MTTAEILAAFPKLSALVVGDICLDRWCTYDPALAEPSRETGIPRVAVVRAEVTPGAGGTVASNLAALGAGRVAVLGVIGDDGFASELERALAARGIAPELLLRAPAIQTFTYTKLLNAVTGLEDLARVDHVNSAPLDPSAERLILDRLLKAADSFDVILVSDQAETASGGVVTPAVRALLADLARAYTEKLFWVDFRARIECFRNMVLKPNRQEAETACRALFGRVDFPALARHTAAKLLIVTQGAGGALVVSEGGEQRVETAPVARPVDICGAGDSFSAGAALALRVTGSGLEAARFGNRVAAITIMKKGTGTATPGELLAHAYPGD
ncbi:MAG: ribokinase [Acidobacteria bacterium]|nr:ribokinase [Acidobacteriota bacterium]